MVLLRETDSVVRLLQRVVATVLAVLAPVLGIGLLLFVLALPFTGLQALWDATDATTPLLLACVIGSLILANAVIGNTAEHESKLPPLRWGAMALALAMLPLAVLAAVATGLRIGQYGFTPERLWALTFVIIACAYGLAYWVSLARGREGWAAYVRPANLNLAFGLCALGLVLATPLISFNAISTRDQVARLESGKISAEKFDWRALAFDFGKPGKEAVKRLQGSKNAAIKAKAEQASKADSRYDLDIAEQEGDRFSGKFDIKPVGAALPEALKKAIADDGFTCRRNVLCRVYLQADGKSAVVIGDGCMGLPPSDRIQPRGKCEMEPDRVYVLRDGKWISSNNLDSPFGVVMTPEQERESLRKEREAIESGDVTVRNVTQQQLFIGDKPVGQPFKQP
jgi:hypothetical protein